MVTVAIYCTCIRTCTCKSVCQFNAIGQLMVTVAIYYMHVHVSQYTILLHVFSMECFGNVYCILVL